VPQTGDLAGAAPGVAVAAAGVRWLQDTVPFCGLLLVVFLQQHLLPILAFSWCTFVLHHANARVRLWLPLLQAPPGGAGVLLVAAEIVTQLLALLLLCGRDLVSQLLLRLPDWALDGATLFGVLLAVLSADVVVRFACMLLKLGALLALRGAAGVRAPCSLRRAFAVLELSGLLYRSLLPIPLWHAWLVHAVRGRLLASLLAGLYLTLKLTQLVERTRAALLATRSLLTQQVLVGKHASAEEVLEAGEDTCSICQEPMTAPVVLEGCSHIFCEECIVAWCERAGSDGATCPLCRQPVQLATGVHACYGDGTTSLLPQVF